VGGTHRARLLSLLIALWPAAAAGQDLEPRAYTNTPVGLNFAIAGYAWTNGDVAVDASLPLEDAKLQTDTAVLAYARSLDVFGTSGKLDVTLPFTYVTGSATFDGEPVERRVSGLGDARFRFSVNFFGAPALSFKAFESYEQDVIVGGRFTVWAPIGQYDDDRLINVGTHRWSFTPELGISKSWAPFILELSARTTFFTDNHDFLGGHDRSQEPISAAEAHAIYAFKRGPWGSLDVTYYGGGETSVDGVSVHDFESNVRVGGTIALPVNRYNSIKLYGSTGVWARRGGKYDLIGIAWQVRWGAGF